MYDSPIPDLASQLEDFLHEIRDLEAREKLNDRIDLANRQAAAMAHRTKLCVMCGRLHRSSDKCIPIEP